MEIPFLNKITIFGRGINQATKNRNTAFMKTIEQIKNSIAQEKGYPSWTQFYNFVSRDGEHIAMANDIEDKRNKIMLLKKALVRMVAEFDTTTPVVPNQKKALQYANELLLKMMND